MNNITVVEKQINYLEDVVYNGLNPSGIAIGGGGGGDTSDLYYSKTQLDGGQLDNRYYTETELNNGQLNNLYYTETESDERYYTKTQLNAGQLNNLYYTETELDTKFGLYYTKTDLDGGQLDNRYYTETEIDTWRNEVTQEEMGWLHGITSDVQTQISARAVISGTPANNQLAVWTNANTIEGTNDLTFDGTVLINKKGYYRQYSTEVGKTDWRLTLYNTNADLAEIVNFDEGESAYRNMVLGNHTDFFYLDLANNGIGINTASPNSPLHILQSSYLGITLERSGSKTLSLANRGSGLLVRNETDDTNLFFVGDDGNVGIGTLNPLRPATVSDSGYIAMFENTSGNADYKRLSLYQASSSSIWRLIRTKDDDNYGDDILSLDLENTRVGINETDPSYKLDVDGDGRFTGAFYLDSTIGTTNYVSETTGWRGTYAGAFDVRSLYTDELIAKTFIADIDLALLSGTMVSKSITQVSRNFTVPANGNTGTLYVEAIPGFPTSQAFEDGDWIRLQVVDRTGGGLQWLRVYGTVTSFVDDGDGEQHYTFTTQYDGLSHGAIGATVHAGAGAQDLGTSGDGFIQSEAGSYSLNTPYIQTATWTTNPYEGANIKVRTRLGNLTGITGQSGFGLVTRKDNTNYVTQWWNTDSDWGIKGMVAGNTVFQLGNTNKIACLTIESTKLYIGTGTFGNANTSYYVDDSGQFSLKDKLTWDGTNLTIEGSITLTNTITSAVISDVSANADQTSINTAANIAGQGALATENAADFATQVDGAEKPANNADVTLSKLNGELSLTGGGLVFASGSPKLRAGQTAYDTGTGFWLGIDTDPKFSIGNSAGNKLTWDGTDLAITGIIHASEGDIGGFTIHATDGLYAGSGATRVQMKAGAGFWTGATAIGDAPFSVTNAGVLDAVSGTIGGWTLATDALYTGTKYTNDDWSTTGITLANDGAIHAPNFYVNTGGEIGLRQVESVLFKTIGNQGIKITGTEIWENENDIDDSGFDINLHGYNGGNTRWRTTVIGDGKGNKSFTFVGKSTPELWVNGWLKVGAGTSPTSALDVITDDASGYAAMFFNDGNDPNRYGIKIQCGEDVVDTDYNYPVRFYDGNGDWYANIEYNTTHGIAFSTPSDIRLKENIKDCNINGLGIISQLQYRSFNWKKNKNKTEVHGWIADEIMKVFPEMVSVDQETGYKTITESRLIPVMMSAIKELNAKVKLLESK